MEIKRSDNANLVSQIDKKLKSPENSNSKDVKYNETESNKNKKCDPNELNAAVDKANRVLFKNNTHLQFKVHEITNNIMVKIIDDKTGEVVKEIPPEKMLDMVAKLWEIAGIIVDEKI